MSKNKMIALIVVGVILLVIIIIIALNLKTVSQTSTGGSTTVATGGIGSLFTNIFGIFSKI